MRCIWYLSLSSYISIGIPNASTTSDSLNMFISRPKCGFKHLKTFDGIVCKMEQLLSSDIRVCSIEAKGTSSINSLEQREENAFIELPYQVIDTTFK